MKTVKIEDGAYRLLEAANKKTGAPKTWIVSRAVEKFLKIGGKGSK